MTIREKTFLVTGAASGLGLATAQLLAAEGGRVVLLDVNENAGRVAAEAIGKAALFIRTDVSSEQDAQQAVQQAVGHFGGIDGLINCAGIGPAARTVGREGPHSLELFHKVISINLLGAFNMIRLAANRMQHNEPGPDGERGVIINTASVAAFDGQIGQAAYAASKGGIVAMALPLAREFARMGIRVMTIAPGIFETPLLAGLPEEARESLGWQVPFPARLGQAGEFAALVRHIIDNRMLNGEVIRLDGAIRMNAK